MRRRERDGSWRAAGEGWIYAYDHRNRLTVATHYLTGGALDERVLLQHDDEGRRTTKVLGTGSAGTVRVSAARSVYDGRALAVSWRDEGSPAGAGGGGSSAGAWTWDVGWGLGGAAAPLILRRARLAGEDATLRWQVTDRQGSVRRVLRADGAAVLTLDYDAFGVATTSGTGVAPRYGYTGQQREAETGRFTAATDCW